MAYAHVSHGSTSASAQPAVPAFGQATTAGNLLVAVVVAQATGTPTGMTCSDGTWFLAVNDANLAAIWYKANCGAGETAPTFTATGQNAIAQLIEFSGGSTTSPLDQTATIGGGATSPGVATAAGVDVASGQLIVTCSEDTLSTAGTATTSDTYNNGATPTNLGNNDGGSTRTHYRLSYGITTGNSSADQNSHADNSVNLTRINGVLASFKLPAAAGPIARQFLSTQG